MKKDLIIIAIYLSGCVVSYITVKHRWEKKFHKWTVADRAIAIGFSTGSWASVLAVGACAAIDTIDTNAPAKW